MKNEITKQFKGPVDTCDIFYAGLKNIIVVTKSTVHLFDTELRTSISEIPLFGVRHVIWSADMQFVAFLSKNGNSIRYYICFHFSCYSLHKVLDQACGGDRYHQSQEWFLGLWRIRLLHTQSYQIYPRYWVFYSTSYQYR